MSSLVEQPEKNIQLIEQTDLLLNNEIVQRHSFFQLKYFNLMKEPTIQAKLWQCLTEMKTRRDSHIALLMEIEESHDRKALAGLKLESLILDVEEVNKNSSQSSARRKIANNELAIKIRQQKRKMVAIDRSIEQLEERSKNLLEELNFFVSAFQSIQAKEPLKPFDDFESQKEAWEIRLSQEISLKKLSGLPLDTEMLKTILALPDEMKVKQFTLKALQDQIQIEDKSGR